MTAGTYCFSSSAQLTGTLTLDAQGDPAAVFVFQIGSTLTTASNASVQVINGGSPCNVFWQVGSSATLGTGTSFEGSILALTSITLTTGVAVDGRVLARNGAVTMDTNNVDAASCQLAGDGGGSSGSGSSGSGSSGSGSSGSGSSGSGSSGSGSSGSGSSGSASSGSASSGSGADGGAEVCADAGKVCEKAQCGSQCVDLQNDCSNCGSCDNVCGPSQTCVNGACCAGNAGTPDAGPSKPVCTTGFSGRAVAVVADVGNGIVHVVTGDTGPLPPGGGDITAPTADAMIPGLLTAQLVQSETSGAAGQAHSSVSTSLSLGLANLGPVLDGLGLTSLVNGLGLGNLLGGLLGLPPALVLPDISVSVLSADSTATCGADGNASAQGSSTLASLMIGGSPVNITGQPNQTITIGPLTIVVNEQTSGGSGSSSSIDVRALHVELPGLLDVVVSDAASDVTCNCGAPGKY